MGAPHESERSKDFRKLTKCCPSCKELKDESQFNKQTRASDGLQTYCRDCQREYNKTPKARTVRSVNKLRYRYALTIEQYEELLRLQSNFCRICGQEPLNGKRLDVDHDHKCCAGEKSCGKCVRSLLCRRCNTVIGQVGEDVDLLMNMIKYLES